MLTIYTIITRNHLPRARVLMADVARWHPDARLLVFLADEIQGHFDPAAEPFTILEPTQFAPIDFRHLAFALPIADFCFSLKPVAALWIRQRYPSDPIIYLDSDMRVMAPMTDLAIALQAHPIVLTPHTMRHDAGLRGPLDPSSGTFNAGLFAVAPSESADTFLRWWQDQMAHPDRILPHLTYDQVWLNHVPVYFPQTHILRHPGYNVAYWNLHERALTHVGTADADWTVNAAPLVVFHFSGFDPGNPENIAGDQSRFAAVGDPRWSMLSIHYAKKLSAADPEACSLWGHRYACFSDGKKINRHHRDYFRNTVWRHLSPPDDPFDAKLSQPAPGLKSLYQADHPITLALRLIRKVQRSFTKPS